MFAVGRAGDAFPGAKVLRLTRCRLVTPVCVAPLLPAICANGGFVELCEDT